MTALQGARQAVSKGHEVPPYYTLTCENRSIASKGKAHSPSWGMANTAFLCSQFGEINSEISTRYVSLIVFIRALVWQNLVFVKIHGLLSKYQLHCNDSWVLSLLKWSWQLKRERFSTITSVLWLICHPEDYKNHEKEDTPNRSLNLKGLHSVVLRLAEAS